MKRFATAIHGVQPNDIVRFCASANPDAFAYLHDGSMPLDESDVFIGDEETGLTSPYAKCYFSASKIQANKCFVL